MAGIQLSGNSERHDIQATVHVPEGEFAYQRPTLHVTIDGAWSRASLFLDIGETRSLFAAVASLIVDLEAADAEWLDRATKPEPVSVEMPVTAGEALA